MSSYAQMPSHERFTFDTLAALREKIHELDADIPLTDDVRVLLEPIQVGGRRLANRLVVQPMEGRDAEPDGSPGPLTLRRYQRYAAGGSGLVWFEATAVVPEGRAAPTQLCLCDASLDAFRRLVARTRAATRDSLGDDYEVTLVLQLTHSGRYARPAGARRPVIAQHSPALDSLVGIDEDYPLASDAELERLQDAFVHVAKLAAAAGFDGVDVKACHGYLVAELLAAHTRPASRFGGPFENRTRFLVETARRIRDDSPGLLVTSRLGVWDGVPQPHGFGTDADSPPGEDLREPQELARRLRDAGCALLSVSAGNPYYNAHVGRTCDLPLYRQPLPDEHPFIGVARLLRLTASIQDTLPDLPVVGTGLSWLRQHFPNVAAAVVRAGGASLIGLGRAAWAYPDFAKDLMTTGKLDPNKTCVTCSRCSQIMRDGGHAGCVVRDADVYAAEYRKARARAGQAARGRI